MAKAHDPQIHQTQSHEIQGTEVDAPSIIECPRCGVEVSAHAGRCPRCQSVIDARHAKTVDQQQADAFEPEGG